MAKDLQIHFLKDKDYKTFPLSGAWGGLTPQGYITMELYHEHKSAPEKLVFENVQEEMQEANATRVGDEEIIRQFFVGCVMNPQVAYSLGQWLINKAKEAGFPSEE